MVDYPAYYCPSAPQPSKIHPAVAASETPDRQERVKCLHGRDRLIPANFSTQIAVKKQTCNYVRMRATESGEQSW